MEARGPAAAGEARGRARPHPNRGRVMRYLHLLSLSLAVTAGLVASGGRAAAFQAPTGPGDLLPPVPAVRLTAPVSVDGELDEPAWQGAPGLSRFTQSEPFEGAAATESTWVWFAYDEHALYVAARMWDSHPDSIHRAALPPRQLRAHRLRRPDPRPVPRPPHRLRVRRHAVRGRHGRHHVQRRHGGRLLGRRVGVARPPGRGDGTGAGPARCASRSRSCASRRASGRSGASTSAASSRAAPRSPSP